MRTRVRGIARLVAVTAAFGCGSESYPDPQPVPVVQVALSAARQSQVALVQWTQDPAGPLSGTPAPVSPADVNLALVGQDGTIHLLLPNEANQGQYTTDLPVLPQTTYRLLGTVLGTEVAGSTAVPDQLQLIQPAADTIRAGPDCRFCPLIIRWRAAGAAILEGIVERQTPEGYVLVTSFLTRNEIDTVFTPFPAPGHGRITLIAHDSAAAAFLFTDPAVDNLHGSLGFIGSQTVLTRVILWE